MKKAALLSIILILLSFKAFAAPGVYWGAFIGDNTSATAAQKFEELTGKKLASVMWFIDWNTDFPLPLCTVLYKNGYIPNITWEPWIFTDKTAINLDKIISGQFDEYISNFARSVKAYGSPLLLRVGHEFNGDWYPWCVANNGKDPEKFKKAWIHIHDIFTKENALNAQWVWCPNAGSAINAQWNDPLLAYPGDSYVDWVGIDGYNFGTYQSWSSWQGFDEIFSPMYGKLSKKIKNKPFIIGEFACADKGGDKAAWISGLENSLKKFPMVRAVTWFNTNKEMDWRVDSSPETLAAFKKTIKSGYFLSSPEGLASLAEKTAPASGAAPQVKNTAAVSDPYIAGQVKDIIIDGEYKENIPYPAAQINSGDADFSGKINVGFDAQSVYIYADINDKTPGVNSGKGENINTGDCIILCLNSNPADKSGRAAFGADDYVIGIKAGDTIETWNWTSKGPLQNPVAFFRKKTGGYVIEAIIPWYNFNIGCSCQLKNKPVCFDLAINDDSGKQIRFSGGDDITKNPSGWGTAVFSTK